jgi:hypothetical protein
VDIPSNIYKYIVSTTNPTLRVIYKVKITKKNQMIMAKFEKGNKLGTGRPKGALNRSTEEMKLTIARAVNNTLSSLTTDLEEIKKRNPERAMELAFKLLEYSLPRLKSIDMNATLDVHQRIEKVVIEIKKNDS